MLPEIVKLDAFKVAGFAYCGQNRHNEIPQMWGEFVKVMCGIPNAVAGKSYGVCSADPSDPELMQYMACVAVSSFDGIPDEMSTGEVPAQTYAVFTHKGDVSKIADTYERIISDWPKELPYVMDGVGVFLEVYDYRFCQQGEGKEPEFDIYAPVLPK